MQTYIEKNRGHITSSKLKEFLRCQFCYQQKYVLEIPDPKEKPKDYFLVGQAFDDLITLGKEEYEKRYTVLARRNGKSEQVELTQSMAKDIENMQKEFLANKVFYKTPSKNVLNHVVAGLKIRCELDDLDYDNRMIRDIKTTSSIATFDPENYILQMAFYYWIVLEKTEMKCEAMLEVVDKYDYFSRSDTYIYSVATLENKMGEIIEGLNAMKVAQLSGLYLPAKERKILLECPYYGFDDGTEYGHGRREPIIL